MIKILFLIHDLGEGGAEKVLINLVNSMDQNKFNITLISLFGGGVNEKYLSPQIHYRVVFQRMIPGNSKIMKLFTPEALHDFIVKEKYDIEISYLEGPSARIISGCQEKGTKLISWIHIEQHTKQVARQSFRSYHESVKCYSRFDKVVCVSESVKKDFLAIYPMIRNVDVLYNTNDTDKIITLKNENIAGNIFKRNEIKICGVGKITPKKGFDRLARIHNKLIENGYKVHTYVLGRGPEEDHIKKYLAEQHIDDSFTFLGYQSNPYKYLARCDLFVCASSGEGFSTAATEALIVGTPVVTTPVAGMREMLGENNEYGVISEMSEDSLYECIKRLISNPQLLAHYKAMAAKRGTFFSKANTVSATENYLKDLVQGN